MPARPRPVGVGAGGGFLPGLADGGDDLGTFCPAPSLFGGKGAIGLAMRRLPS